MKKTNELPRGLHRHPRSNNLSMKFRFGGKQFCKSLKTDNELDAAYLQANVMKTKEELETGRRELAEGADL